MAQHGRQPVQATVDQQQAEAWAHAGGDVVELYDGPTLWNAVARAEAPEPVAYVLSPTDIYAFAGWLTTRPGTMVVGSSHEAGPMAEAVGEYLKTFPERFTAPPARNPLTDEQIIDAVRDADLDWHQGWTVEGSEPNRYALLARAIERAHGIKE
jgi:hypothetical protein